jgi:hypothetical protein
MDTENDMKSEEERNNGVHLETIKNKNLTRFRRPKIIYSLSYVDFRSRANAAMLLDLRHTLRGEHIREEWG